MPYPSGTYITQILDSWTRAELEQFYSLLQGYLSAQHKEDGSHGDVTADNVTIADVGTLRAGTIVPPEPFSSVVEIEGQLQISNSPGGALGLISIPGTGGIATGGDVSGRDLTASDQLFERGRSTAVGEWQAYTPTWSTGGTLNNGTLAGRYTLIGKTCHYKIALTVGSTTTFSGAAFLFTLPVTKRNDAFASVDAGAWFALDSSVGATYGGLLQTNTTQVQPVTFSLVVNNQINSTLTTTVPFTWATGDVLEIQGSYEIA